MGTSTGFGGQGGGTPLVPSWLGDEGSPPSSDTGTAPAEPAAADQPPPAPDRPPVPPEGDPGRFSAARSNFTRFAGSGGTDTRSLGRAVSGYVGSSSGGARAAAARMGSARGAGSRLVGFLADVATRGATLALQALNLGDLAGRPIEEVFLGLSDTICPDGGSIDEGIARDAFIETITDLAAAGITDLDAITPDQMTTVFELYATNAIEARLCNDVGTKAIMLPASARDAARVQAQLHDFIRRGVADALASARSIASGLTQDRVIGFVSGIYEQAFGILQALGDAEAQA